MTYVAVSNDSERKTEIVSFVEEAQSDSSDLPTDSQQKATYSLSKKNVYAIYALASHSDNKDLASALDICVIYEDGLVDSLSGDLATKRWDADAVQAIALGQGAAATPFGRVEYATVTDVEKARKGLLKSREDALAVIMGSSLTAADDSAALNIPLLVLATTDEASHHIHIFALPSRSKDLIVSLHSGLRHLLTHRLPNTEAASDASPSDHAKFSLHASTGKLQQLCNGSITTFDLSQTVPHVLSTLTPRNQPYTSFVRLSPALLLASDSTVCAMYDVKYTSLQGQLPLTTESVDSPGKRKRAEVEPTTLDFVSFYSDLGLAVAISKNTLIGVQVNTSAPAYKKSKSGTSLLVNSLAKGFADDKQNNMTSDADFELWKIQVDGLLADANTDLLERFIAAELDVVVGVAAPTPKPSKPTKRGRSNKEKYEERLGQAKATKSDSKPNGKSDSKPDGKSESKPAQDKGNQVANPNQSEAPQVWDFGNTALLIQKTDRRKALYILSNMFTWTSSASHDQPSINLVFFAPNIFKWLALTGYLSSATIGRALGQTTASLPQYASAKVQPGDLIRALNELDPEMHIMHEYLSWPIYIDIDQVTIALRTLIKSLDDPKPGLISKLITSGALDTSLLPSSLAAIDEQGALEAAEADLHYAAAQLDHGLNVRSTSLRTVFQRLHAFPRPALLQALKTHLSQSHLTFFIQLLRVELADGGWTSAHLDPFISPRVHDLVDGGERPADNSLTIISNLLSCGVDAVGLTGWMVPPSREKDDVIETLRAETAAALEGAHEACEMGIYLSDFEKFAVLLRQQEKDERREHGGRALVSAKVDPVRRPGFEEVGEARDVMDPVLPMGMRVVKFEKMLVRSGGREQKKSRSLLVKERSMRVGKYSFDRIRV